jgi:methylated-DNA-[protein]-cysteine S-methyltransferase
MLTLAPAAVYARVASPFGPLVLRAEDGVLTGLFFADCLHAPPVRTDDFGADPVFAMVEEQVAEYARGERRAFDLPWRAAGTDFNEAVWMETAKIPFGATITYGELAARAGHPHSARAVGAALGRNPVCLVVPCHRVIGADGQLTGFAGGVDRKRRLLELEAVR